MNEMAIVVLSPEIPFAYIASFCFALALSPAPSRSEGDPTNPVVERDRPIRLRAVAYIGTYLIPFCGGISFSLRLHGSSKRGAADVNGS
jgi:hypothetical protein